jgi:hypothetical protein
MPITFAIKKESAEESLSQNGFFPEELFLLTPLKILQYDLPKLVGRVFLNIQPAE